MKYLPSTPCVVTLLVEITHTHTHAHSDLVVLGRCTVDIRVCASPGRDRSSDERKLMGEGTSSDNIDGSKAGVTTRRGRKRGECVGGGTGGRVRGGRGRGSTRGEYVGRWERGRSGFVRGR